MTKIQLKLDHAQYSQDTHLVAKSEQGPGWWYLFKITARGTIMRESGIGPDLNIQLGGWGRFLFEEQTNDD